MNEFKSVSESFRLVDKIHHELMELSENEVLTEKMADVLKALDAMAVHWGNLMKDKPKAEDGSLVSLVILASSLGLISGFIASSTGLDKNSTAWAGAVLLGIQSKLVSVSVSLDKEDLKVSEDSIGEVEGHA